MVLENEIPELIPFKGLRIKIQHLDVTKLCTGCYGEHLRKNCKEAKKSWDDYVKIFAEQYPDIPKEFFGEHRERREKRQMIKEPTLKDFMIPTTQTEWNEMMSKMLWY